MFDLEKPDMEKEWFVLRDLSRCNAKMPAYKLFESLQFEVFTPMTWCVVKSEGKSRRIRKPLLQDLLFVYSTFEQVEHVIARHPSVQFRYYKGGGYRNPMTVRKQEMNRFIETTKRSDDLTYYAHDEVTASMVDRRIRIAGGQLDGLEGTLRTVRGSRRKQLLVELPGFLYVGVVIKDGFIQML